MSDRVLGFVEVASAACITVGAAVVAPAAGWIAAGCMGMLFAWRASS